MKFSRHTIGSLLIEALLIYLLGWVGMTDRQWTILSVAAAIFAVVPMILGIVDLVWVFDKGYNLEGDPMKVKRREFGTPPSSPQEHKDTWPL